jgi:hypothetical protein
MSVLARISRFAAILTCVLVCAGAAATSVSATVPHSGWGLSIADDETHWEDLNYLPNLEDGFARLRPKVFRLQTIWNTMAPYNDTWRQRTHKQIDRALLHGAEQIILTVRSNNPANVGPDPYRYFPTPAEYEVEIGKLVTEFAGKVDVWGPANEPNGAWRPWNAPGGAAQLDPVTLAGYYQAMQRQVAARDDGQALMTSPDFLDRGNLAPISAYVNAYTVAGGGWGNAAAWHPYNGVIHGSLQTTNDFASLVPGNRPIWVTEIGAHYADDPLAQNSRVSWIINTLGSHPRVARIGYYHMRDNNPDWDTALLDSDNQPRPAWYTWCKAAHGDNASHSDCTGYPAQPPPPPSNHFLYFTDLTGAISQWHTSPNQWHLGTLGGSATGSPAAYVMNGQHYVYFRGSDGAIWQWHTAGNQWHLGRLGGSAVGSPMAYHMNGQHYVYFRGSDGAVWQWHTSPSQWHLGRLGGSASGDPVGYAANGQHFVYFTGADGAMWQWHTSPSQWHLGRLGGASTGAPAAYYGGGQHYVYFRGSDGAVWQWHTSPSQWNLGRLGGSAAGSPSAYYKDGQHYVYFRGTDQEIWQWHTSPNQWHLGLLGGSAAGDPAAYTANGEHFVYFTGLDGAVWQWHTSPNKWHLGRLGGSASTARAGWALAP